jgi:hypothetical protein
MMEAVRTSETSVDNHFTRQYNPEDSSEQNMFLHGGRHFLHFISSLLRIIAVTDTANSLTVTY